MVKVDDFLSQSRIAVAGVSRDPKGGNAANGIYRRFRELGYQVYAVNPNAEQVEGDPCYHSVKDIPEQVDGVIIATPADASRKVVRDCAEVGHQAGMDAQRDTQPGDERFRQRG